ncbi:MAG: LysR substrate-binding domain-containing protein [Solirubrobacteraceae bacterium]
MSGTDPRLPGGELAAFVAAVETGTVGGAADSLNLTQSAATKRIQTLERRVGARLLQRGPLGVAPTDLGLRLYPEAKHVLAALDAAERVLAEQDTRDAPLHLAASRTLGEFVLPGLLTAFRLTAGGGRVELDVRNSLAVLAAVRGGEVDIGFVEGADPLDGLDVLTLLRDEIVVVVSVRHPWARRGRVSPSELAREAFFTREQGSGTRAVAETALSRVGVTLSPTLEAASTHSLKRAVRDGGFTLLSRLAVEDDDAGTLAIVAVHGADLSRELRAVRVSGRALTPGERRFWSFLRSGAGFAAPEQAPAVSGI